MLKYKLVHTDPTPYKDKIFEFWDKYLPGTDKGRFEWMNNNPAGLALWFMAWEESAGELSGTISIMPRKLFNKGKIIRAGIMGDFMIRSKDRIFGPSLMLPKFAISKGFDTGFDIIYTIPNSQAQKLIERIGFEKGMALKLMVKPLLTKHYLEKYLIIPFAKLAAPICDKLIILLAKETCSCGGGIVGEENSVDSSFDELWEIIRDRCQGIIGDHSGEYLRWRYFQNPQFVFRLLTLRGRNNILLGYLIYSMGNGKLEVYDILVAEKSHALLLLRKLSGFARSEGGQAMYLRVSANSPLFLLLARCLFIKVRDDVKVHIIKKPDINLDEWSFFSGERNI